METIEDVKDELDAENIEATLGRILDGHGGNRPFVHTCDEPSQTCECWIAVEGENRTEYIWLSVRPNRRTRRYKDLIRKEPLHNDGTPKRFIGTVRPGPSQARGTSPDRGRTQPGIQRQSGANEAESGAARQGGEDR